MDERVNSSERKLLEAFDTVEGENGVLRLAEATALQAETGEDLAGLRLVAEDLVARGLLRRAGLTHGGADTGTYTRTEDGRIEAAGPLDVTFYTRPGCHLCEQAKALIVPLLQSAGGRLREVNIDADEILRQRYHLDVPVVFLGVRKVAKHRVEVSQFQRQLAEAVQNITGAQKGDARGHA